MSEQVIETDTIWVNDGVDVNALAESWDLSVRVFTVMERHVGGALVAIIGPEDDFWTFMERYDPHA